jgi:diaminopimelate decarboxylase
MAPRISFAGPGKSDAELAQAVAAGVVRATESEREIRALARIGDSSASRRAVLRINPDFELKSSGMKMGGGAKQFGIDAEQAPACWRWRRRWARRSGFHIFSGSQSLKAEAIIEAQAADLELALRLADDAPRPVRLLNIGGGFGIPYFPGELALDLRRSARNLAQLPRVQGGAAAGAGGDRTGALPGGRGRRVRGARDRPQGLARPGVPGHRRRPAPPPGGVGQFRPGDPQELSGRDRQPHGGLPGTRCPWSARCARRSTCWPTSMDLPHAEVGDLVVVFQSGAYGLQASPPPS